MNKNTRNQIYQEALARINDIPNVVIEIERGSFRMHDYLQSIKEDGKLSYL